MNDQRKQERLSRKKHKLLLYQNTFWQQKYRSNHLSLGDYNTKYYHAFANIRKNRNQMKLLVDNNGNNISPIQLRYPIYSRQSLLIDSPKILNVGVIMRLISP